MSFLLEANQIAHSFDTTLFSDVNCSLSPKESISIVGRSGCGKSTLLHIFSTLLKPNSGNIKLLGKNLYNLTEYEIELTRRYDIGIIFQFHYLFKGMSALSNIEIASLLSKQKIDKEIFKKLEIDNLINSKIGDLSGGQQQRVSIARVLSKKPKIIFADEPTGNLDNQTAKQVMQVLFDYIQTNNAGLFIVTHDEDIAKKCDKEYIIEDKKLQQIKKETL